jgi:hypothetical protein
MVRFLDASIDMWRHIEKCSPRNTRADGYHWQTGDAPCFDPEEHARLRHEETAAWRAFRSEAP